MNSFWGSDGQLLGALTKFGRLIYANVLWLVCLVPVVTIIPATTSFYYTVIKSVKKERGYIAEEFFRSMKRTIKKGIALTLVWLLWLLVLWYGRAFAIANQTDRFSLLLFAYDVLMVVSGSLLTCLIPIFSRFEMPLIGLMKLSFVTSIRYFYFSIPLMMGNVLLGWMLIVKLPMLCIVFLPGIWCYVATFIVERMLRGYMPQAKEDEDAWYLEKK